MATAIRNLDLDDLRKAAKGTPALLPYVDRLERIRDRVQERCSDIVLWAVAYGTFVDLVGTGKTRSTAREKFLFVTNLKSVYDSYETLADRVLGPILVETGRVIEYEAWTLEEYRRIADRETSDLLRTALTKGVTLFGSPPHLAG